MTTLSQAIAELDGYKRLHKQNPDNRYYLGAIDGSLSVIRIILLEGE